MGSQADRVRITGSILLDTLVIAASYWAAPVVRDLLDPFVYQLAGTWSYDRMAYNLFLAPVIVCMLLSLWGFGCYQKDRRDSIASVAPRILAAVVVAHLLLALLTFYVKADFLSRGVMLIFLVVNVTGLLIVRNIIKRITKSATKKRTIIAGTDRRATQLAAVLIHEEDYDVVGFLDVGGARAVAEDRILGSVSETARILHQYTPIDEVTIAVRELETAAAAVDAAEERGVAVRQLLYPLATSLHKVYFEHVAGLNMLTMNPSAASAMALFVKRVADTFGALVGLILTGLLFPFIALAIKLDSAGPVIYTQDRVGLNGRVFKLYKFRTMMVNAHEMRQDLAHLNVMKGPRFKIEEDPRVTRVGRLLRRFSIDELPQFLSVLKGDMSLVGPRPFPIEEVRRYQGQQYRRLGMKPGLTGLWQIGGRCDLKDFEPMLAIDEEYIQNWSLWLDLKILLKTIPSVLMGKGAMYTL